MIRKLSLGHFSLREPIGSNVAILKNAYTRSCHAHAASCQKNLKPGIQKMVDWGNILQVDHCRSVTLLEKWLQTWKWNRSTERYSKYPFKNSHGKKKHK